MWPHGGSPSDLIASIKSRLSGYPVSADIIVFFDKYQGLTAKDHERMRHAGDAIIDFDLSISTSLPKRNVILRSKNNKKKLASVLSTFNITDNVTMETKDDGADEADITIVSYVLAAATYGKNIIRVLSDDTDCLCC